MSVNFDSWRTCGSRRSFVRSAFGACGAFLMPAIGNSPTLRFAVMQISGGIPFGDGAIFGYAEARRTAELFQKGTLEPVNVFHDALPTRAAGIPTLLARHGAQVIVGALGDEDTSKAALECDRAGVIFINCGAKADNLRREICSPLVFHVESSAAMYASARKLAPPNTDIVLWSDRLEKYGASQLNDRFRAAEGAGMTSWQWAGWFAIKAVWESFLRIGSSDPALLARHMTSDGATFDGHKGAALSFRKWDRQLRQPLFAMTASTSAPPRDIPDTSRSNESIRDLLDTIGDAASETKCTTRQ
jgi:hypothetical protein